MSRAFKMRHDESGSYSLTWRQETPSDYGLCFAAMGLVVVGVGIALLWMAVEVPAPEDALASGAVGSMAIGLLLLAHGLLLLLRRYRLTFDPSGRSVEARAIGFGAVSTVKFSYDAVEVVLCRASRAGMSRPWNVEYGLSIFWRGGQTPMYRAKTLDEARAAAELLTERTGLACHERLDRIVYDIGLGCLVARRAGGGPADANIYADASADASTAADGLQEDRPDEDRLVLPMVDRAVAGVLTASIFALFVAAAILVWGQVAEISFPEAAPLVLVCLAGMVCMTKAGAVGRKGWLQEADAWVRVLNLTCLILIVLALADGLFLAIVHFFI